MLADRLPKWLPWVVTVVIGAIVVVGSMLWLRSDGSVAPDEANPPPRFIEETDVAGISHVYDGDFEFFVGGGVAVLDCNDDGMQDVYLAGGSNPAALYINESTPGGALRFSRQSSDITDLGEVLGAYPLDVDSDARTDLIVLRLGENVVLRGLGGCKFERANEEWEIDGGDSWTAAFAAKWEAGNVLPTLAFGNYLEWPVDRTRAAECADNQLLRPQGNVYSEPTDLSPGWCTLSIMFSDWGRNGDVDLRIANDRHYYVDGSEQLWQVEPGAPPRLYTEADGWEGLQIWGMGIASHDVTGDGPPEWFITSQGDNKLQTLEGDPERPAYKDIAIRSGVTAHRPFTGDDIFPSTAWHPEFQDVNNDGFIDLFITKGNVEAMPEYAMADPNNLLLGQPDGKFVEGATEADVASMGRSRGGALADFNLDGMLDLLVVNRTENIQIWRNLGRGDAETPVTQGNFLAIQLAMPGHNRDAIGAWVEVELGEHVISREIAIGGGHAGDQLGWIHFGIGESASAKVTVEWPGDIEPSTWEGVRANSFVILGPGLDPIYLDNP